MLPPPMQMMLRLADNGSNAMPRANINVEISRDGEDTGIETSIIYN